MMTVSIRELRVYCETIWDFCYDLKRLKGVCF